MRVGFVGARVWIRGNACEIRGNLWELACGFVGMRVGFVGARVAKCSKPYRLRTRPKRWSLLCVVCVSLCPRVRIRVCGCICARMCRLVSYVRVCVTAFRRFSVIYFYNGFDKIAHDSRL